MKILYIRVSSLDQKTDRQKTNTAGFKVYEDYCSGSIAFADRDKGKEIIKLLKDGKVESLTVSSIDRLCRNVQDLLNTIELFKKNGVSITFLNQGLKTLDENGNENSISRMIISILGVVSEMERTQIRERQREGILIAKAKGIYNGRKVGSKEDTLKFLSKPRNYKVLEYLKMGNLTGVEISKLTGVNMNTITKVKKLGLIERAK
ncbi:recombinase family protein [Pedobacter sp. CFBP9032]|uniref:recombinase family protein n=1 Tax=Pedobacter sp. CFBP9032 TaxID=3096539 RepID=UPI002A6AAF00|nr:recombinase family protein [Pedobacter sp. CFBP9032]MDY0905628.1 recombinase family protein [Pedobacter sp. CFBP9032]